MRKDYQYILTDTENRITTIWLNRPEVQNAFHFEMLNELNEILQDIKKIKPEIVVFRGRGKSFCAGADIQWFNDLRNFNESEIRKQLKILQEVLWEINHLPSVTVSILKGSVMGGGIGLSATCDFVIAAEDTKMAFKEVKLGIIPALISPFIVYKIGVPKAKELMLRGALIDVEEAQKSGLVSQVVKQNQLDNALKVLVKDLLEGGKGAKQMIRKLIFEMSNNNITREMLEKALNNLISVIKAPEADEGFKAFFEKRKPDWY
ncbi:MAG: enoyl-CoA hydratase/isomerase family protein [Prolixibacteraceae bacterium]|nr:enoyl-CoA hydratase/isomerase family protein [Prolixibacteraceae bacterium]